MYLDFGKISRYIVSLWVHLPLLTLTQPPRPLRLRRLVLAAGGPGSARLRARSSRSSRSRGGCAGYGSSIRSRGCPGFLASICGCTSPTCPTRATGCGRETCCAPTRSADRDADGIELCALDHDDTTGPGARWARSLSVGGYRHLWRSEGRFVLADGAYHVFAGEETAAVAFGAMLRALPAEAPVYGVVEVDEPGDRLPLPRELRWRYRHGRPRPPRKPCLRRSPGFRCRPSRGSLTWRARPRRSNCSAITSSATAAGRGGPSG